ncbi:hypothetical protein N8149_00180 [Gammaproteobacteria bacterium]|nr:hypothetical protein [Gammaproteobacteria bacterium]
MNESDKTLINAYFDEETSEDETTYIESLLQSSDEANEYANNIKKANNEINTYFNSSEILDLKTDIDKFIEKRILKSPKTKFNLLNLFYNPKYYGFAASAIFLTIILIPTFNENQSDNLPNYLISSESSSFLSEILKPISNTSQFDDLPTYLISSERDVSDVIDFDEIFNDAVRDYGDKSVWAFKIQSNESILIVQINDLKNQCFVGTVSRAENSEIKEFKVCKE